MLTPLPAVWNSTPKPCRVNDVHLTSMYSDMIALEAWVPQLSGRWRWQIGQPYRCGSMHVPLNPFSYGMAYKAVHVSLSPYLNYSYVL